jgi:hypothetical protein
VIWGFSNTDFYHTPISELPSGVDGQSYHPYGTDRKRIPDDFPERDQTALFVDGFIPRLSWCMPEGWAHLATKVEQLPRHVLYPATRSTAHPPGSESFVHYFTEHGFLAREAGMTDGSAAQSYKAKALIRALVFWLNKGVSRIDIYADYGAKDELTGILWSEPSPSSYRKDSPPARSPALKALKNLVAQFAGADPLSNRRELGVEVTALGGAQPEVFRGENGRSPLYYREMFAFLPFQVTATRFVVATYVMSYDITQPPPPMRFRLDIEGIRGSRAHVRYYDPIADADVTHSVDAREEGLLALTVEQVEHPRLIVIEER